MKWTNGDTIRARALYAEFRNYTKVAQAMGRPVSTVRDWLHGYRVGVGYVPHRDTRGEKHIPPEVLAERDRRAMLAPRDLTAAFFGDPLPGYSALERR